MFGTETFACKIMEANESNKKELAAIRIVKEFPNLHHYSEILYLITYFLSIHLFILKIFVMLYYFCY